MVLVGHSMGGVLSKMMAQRTGRRSGTPRSLFPERSSGLRPSSGSARRALVFEPVPFVSRVVFIATPHRGSPIANGPVGWAVSRLMRRPMEQAERIAEIEALNGPNVLTPRAPRPLRINAIGNLRTDSPILAALDRIPIDPTVPYHSIIPCFRRRPIPTAWSSTAARISRVRNRADRRGRPFSQETPEVTREIRRILLEHLEAGTAMATATARPRDANVGRVDSRKTP